MLVYILGVLTYIILSNPIQTPAPPLGTIHMRIWDRIGTIRRVQHHSGEQMSFGYTTKHMCIMYSCLYARLTT